MEELKKGTQHFDADKKLKNAGILFLAGYLFCVILFYFLAGDQLLYRNSQGDTVMPPAEGGSIELSEGALVEQHFQMKVQRVEAISIRWGAYYRQNAGTVTVELVNLATNETILGRTFDVATIEEAGITVMDTPPIDGLYEMPLLLRLYSIDGQPGSSVSPLINKEKETAVGLENTFLFFNGEPADGVLCFSVSGTDYIWTGLHYWLFVGIGFALVLLITVTVWSRYKQGKRSYIANAVFAVSKYQFLIRQLVSRDFKTKYKRSVLGVLWSFLNPLLMMLVQYFVFSNVFRSNITNFAAYLLVGVTLFNFFSEACGLSLTSILGNGGLITKVYMPKYIYPLTRVISSLINLSISLIPLFIVCLITGVHFYRSTILAVFFFACVVIFSLGMGFLLSTSMVFFRDTQFLWNVMSMMWMYATPLFYPESIIPERFSFILKINPLYYFLRGARMCILSGISPEPFEYMRCLCIAICMLVLGAVIFYKNQDKFVLYL